MNTEYAEKIPFVQSDFLAKPEYKIDVLKALKEVGFNSGYIRKNKIFPESTVQKFRTGNTDISINTIFRVCQILNKDISEVIAFRAEVYPELGKEQEQEQECFEENTKKGVEEEIEVSPELGKEQEQEQEQECFEENTKKGVEEEIEVSPELGKEQEQEQENFTEFIKTDIENIEIECLDLFIKTYNILKRAGVNTIADLKNVDPRNLGKRTITEVKNALQELK